MSDMIDSQCGYEEGLHKISKNTMYVFGGEDGAEAFAKFKMVFVPDLLKMLEDGDKRAQDLYASMVLWGNLMGTFKGGDYDL